MKRSTVRPVMVPQGQVEDLVHRAGELGGRSEALGGGAERRRRIVAHHIGHASRDVAQRLAAERAGEHGGSAHEMVEQVAGGPGGTRGREAHVDGADLGDESSQHRDHHAQLCATVDVVQVEHGDVGHDSAPASFSPMWAMTAPCSASGLKRMTSASSVTRTECPGGQ